MKYIKRFNINENIIDDLNKLSIKYIPKSNVLTFYNTDGENISKQDSNYLVKNTKDIQAKPFYLSPFDAHTKINPDYCFHNSYVVKIMEYRLGDDRGEVLFRFKTLGDDYYIVLIELVGFTKINRALFISEFMCDGKDSILYLINYTYETFSKILKIYEPLIKFESLELFINILRYGSDINNVEKLNNNLYEIY